MQVFFGKKRGNQKKNRLPNQHRQSALAGETRFEHATSGFGDRCSTIEPLPYKDLMNSDNMKYITQVFA